MGKCQENRHQQQGWLGSLQCRGVAITPGRYLQGHSGYGRSDQLHGISWLAGLVTTGLSVLNIGPCEVRGTFWASAHHGPAHSFIQQ